MATQVKDEDKIAEQAAEAAKAAVSGEPSPEAPSVRKYVRSDLSVVTADALDALDVIAPGETLARLTDPGERSEIQAKVDAAVKAAHEAWVKAGKPSGMEACIKAGVVRRYFLDPEHRAAYTSLLNNAARFLGVRVRKAPVQPHPGSGRHQLPWVAMDKRAPSVKPETPGS